MKICYNIDLQSHTRRLMKTGRMYFNVWPFFNLYFVIKLSQTCCLSKFSFVVLVFNSKLILIKWSNVGLFGQLSHRFIWCIWLWDKHVWICCRLQCVWPEGDCMQTWWVNQPGEKTWLQLQHIKCSLTLPADKPVLHHYVLITG